MLNGLSLRSLQALSSRGQRTEQLAVDGRGRGGGGGEGNLNPETGYPYGYTDQQIEYGQVEPQKSCCD